MPSLIDQHLRVVFGAAAAAAAAAVYMPDLKKTRQTGKQGLPIQNKTNFQQSEAIMDTPYFSCSYFWSLKTTKIIARNNRPIFFHTSRYILEILRVQEVSALYSLPRTRTARSICELPYSQEGSPPRMDAHYMTFWRRSAAMTAELSWIPMGVATGYRGNPRVSTASATAHGPSTANATVVATVRAAVLSVAKSVVPTMATHGSPRQLPRQFPRTSNHSNFHGHLR